MILLDLRGGETRSPQWVDRAESGKMGFALTEPSIVLLGVGLLWALTAAVVDVRHHRIPNWLTYSGMIVGLGAQLVLSGPRGLVSGLAGALFAGGIFLVFFLARAMGGGDVKLVTALGCFVGWPDIGQVLIAIAIAGGILAIVYMVWHRRIVATLRNVAAVLQHHATAGIEQHPSVNLGNPRALRMPYGLAIAAGMVYWFTRVLYWR